MTMKTGVSPAPQREDILTLLKNRRKSLAIRSLKWGRLRSRMMAFVAMTRGEFNFGEWLAFLLPGSMWPHELAVKYALWHDMQYEYLIKDILTDSDTVRLYGVDFRFASAYEMVWLVYSVINRDQYCAKRFLKEDSIVIDAGANIGAFSILGTRLVPRGHIYAFEPAPKTFAMLRANTESYKQIVCVPSGLGDVTGYKNILIKDEKENGGSVFEDSPFFERFKNDPGALIAASVTTIDSFVAARGLPQVDFIKIDTEGYEAKIMEGARETIKKWKPIVAMSAYHNPNDKEDLPRLLKEICPDYTCELQKDCEEDLICFVKIR